MTRYLLLLTIVLLPGLAEAESFVWPHRYHLGDDEDLGGWSELYGPSWETPVELENIALFDGELSLEVFDVDSGFNDIVDKILWDGELVAVMDSTTPEPGGSPGDPLEFHEQWYPVPAELLIPGEHTLGIASDGDFNGEIDDFMFQNVRLTYVPGLLGDMNADGRVDGLDVDPFVCAVINEPFNLVADMNGDGAVTGLDVAPFVDAVIAGGVQAVPEPSTFALATLALGLLCWRRKGR